MIVNKQGESVYGVTIQIGKKVYSPEQIENLKKQKREQNPRMLQELLRKVVGENNQKEPITSKTDMKKINNISMSAELAPGLKVSNENGKVNKKLEGENGKAEFLKRKPNISPRTPIRVKKYYYQKVDSNILQKIQHSIENNLEAQGDLGNQILSKEMQAGERAVKTFRLSQKATPHVLKASIKMSRVPGRTIRVIKKLDAITAMAMVGAIDKTTLKNMAISQVSNSRSVRAIQYKVQMTQNAVAKAKHYLVVGKNGVLRVVILTKGIALNKVKVYITHSDLMKLRKLTFKALGKGAQASGKAVVYTAKSGVFVGNKINNGMLGAGDLLTANEDLGTQAMGHSLKTVHYVGKGIGYAPKLVKRTFKTAVAGERTIVKVGKVVGKSYIGVNRAVKIAKRNGIKSAAKLYGKSLRRRAPGKLKRVVEKAARGAVTAVVEITKGIGMKILLPLLLIIVLVIVAMQVISTAGMAIASIFSPYLSGEAGEIDETTWLINNITLKRTALVNEVKNTYHQNLIDNGGEYHYIRFFNALNDAEIELSDTNILTSIYSLSEYQEYIQPIFHTLMFSEYELEASDSEMEEILDNIWSSLSSVKTEELAIEFCFAGNREPDGQIHADTINCPNYSKELFHGDDSEALCSCDYWYYVCHGHKENLDCGKEEHSHTNFCYDFFNFCYTCGKEGDCGKAGHDVREEKSLSCDTAEHTHSNWISSDTSGCYETSFHSGRLTSDCGNSTRQKGCNGYRICNGHKILALSVELSSFNNLLDKYYRTEINNLESKGNLNTDEETRLLELQDNYDICITYMEILQTEFGLGSGSIVDLEGVTLTEITEFACQFIGNPYVWGGNDPNTGADCSGFVKYVYAHFGVELPRVSYQQVGCGITISDVAEAKEGDLIFWSDNGTDSGVYHVAIYLGEGKIVHASNSKPYPQGGIKVSNLYGTIYKIKRIVE